MPEIVVPTGEGLPFVGKAPQREHSRAYVTFGATQQTGGKTSQGGINSDRNSLISTRARQYRGFTLLEVTIALVMLTLITLGLMGALRTFGEVGSRIEVRSEQGDELRLVPVFLDQALRLAQVRRFAGDTDGQRPIGGFWGESERLQWLGVMPARAGFGGLSHFRLERMEYEGEWSLVLWIAPVTVIGHPPDWSLLGPQLMVNDLSALQFWYRDTLDDPWLPRWDDPTRLPGWVRMAVQKSTTPWPELSFRLYNAGS